MNAMYFLFYSSYTNSYSVSAISKKYSQVVKVFKSFIFLGIDSWGGLLWHRFFTSNSSFSLVVYDIFSEIIVQKIM